MTTLTQTSTIFKKYLWTFGIILLIVIASLIGIIISQLTDLKPKQTYQSIEKPMLQNIPIKNSGFCLEKLTLPDNYLKQLPIYSKGKNVNFLNDASIIAQKLNFQITPKELNDKNLGKGLIYSDKTGVLSIYSHNISYQKFPSIEPVTINNLGSTDNLKLEAMKILSSLNLQANISQNFRVSYYKTVEEFLIRVENAQEAEFATLDFNLQINNIDLISSKKTASLTFNKLGQITNFIYNSLEVNNPKDNYPVISPKKAAEQISKGTASLINLNMPNTYNPAPQNLGLVDLLSTKLAYFYSDNQDTIQPVWIFYGQTENNREKTELIYAVPAISPKLFSNP